MLANSTIGSLHIAMLSSQIPDMVITKYSITYKIIYNNAKLVPGFIMGSRVTITVEQNDVVLVSFNIKYDSRTIQ